MFGTLASVTRVMRAGQLRSFNEKYDPPYDHCEGGCGSTLVQMWSMSSGDKNPMEGTPWMTVLLWTNSLTTSGQNGGEDCGDIKYVAVGSS